MAEKMLDYEYHPGEELVLRFRPPKSRLLPASTRRHLLASQREFFLALRGLLDTCIEGLEKVEREEEPKKRTRIEVKEEPVPGGGGP